LHTALFTYIAYGVLFCFGHLRDFFSSFMPSKSTTPKGYAPLLRDFEDFYTRRLFHRVSDMWNRPISSCPGAWIDVMERRRVGKKFELTGTTRRCFNIGSYNYLGFGDPDSPTKGEVMASLEQFGTGTAASRNSVGSTTLHRDLELIVARFLNKEDSMIFGMGFATNSCGIPSLIGKGGLIISDATNHASMVVGARSSGASIKVFKHNDLEDLEAVIRRSIIDGQPRSRRPWKKILIMIEGIYSMEGEVPPLKAIVELKKKYGCYLYVDEAHSIGALGPNGRGICEHAGVNTADVDILMGTFTKAFGSVGGYIAGSKELINYIKSVSAAYLAGASMSPPAIQQCISAFKIMMGEDGTDIGRKKLSALHENANFLRKGLIDMGLHVIGDWDSPICPVLIYGPGRLTVSRNLLARNIAIVVVGYPATPLLLCRTRFCVSAAHTKEDLQYLLDQLNDLADTMGFRFGKRQNVEIPFSKYSTASASSVRGEIEHKEAKEPKKLV